MNKEKLTEYFPGFFLAFNKEAIGSMIAKSLEERGKESVLKRVEIVDVRYKPARACAFLYKAHLEGRDKDAKIELFLGKVLMKEEAAGLYPKEAIYSENLKIIVSPFPYDLAMEKLPDLCNKEVMKKNLAAVVPKERYSIEDLHITLLAYTPLMRATFLYELELFDKVSQMKCKKDWIAKTNAYKASCQVFEKYWALWRLSDGKIPMPKPMGFLVNPGLTLQEKIHGTRLGAIVGDPKIGKILESVAESIAAFHRLRLPITNSRNLEQELKTFNHAASILCDLCPGLKGRVERLKIRIMEEIREKFVIEGPVHADFHHSNLLVEGQKVSLIDMDEVSLGDPCTDVGRFLSSLRIPSLRTYGSFDGLKEERELFLSRYLELSQKDERRVRLFESSSLFISAASTFRLQRSNWENEVEWLLEESEKIFEEVKKKPQKLFCNTPCQALSKEEKNQWAKDAVYLKAALSPHFFRDGAQELLSCKFLTKDERSGFKRLSLEAKVLQDRAEKDFKIDLYIHPHRKRRALHQFMEMLYKEGKRAGLPDFFPRPLGYISEFSALGFYGAEGKSLQEVIESKERFEAAEQMAKGFLLLHALPAASTSSLKSEEGPKRGGAKIQKLKLLIEERLKKAPQKLSYGFFCNGVNQFKFDNGSVKAAFPIKKYVGSPFSDVGRFFAKWRHFGIQKDKREQVDTFLKQFLFVYSESLGGLKECLSLFIAEELLNIAVESAESKELLKEAEKILA